MVFVSLSATILSIALLFFSAQNGLILAGLYCLFGGFTFTLYPLCINHTRDVMEERDILSVTQGLLLAFSIGRATGPQIASCFMMVAGPKGLLIHFILMTFVLALFFNWRVKQTTQS